MTINKTENFIKKSNEIHNNSYSYLKTVYVNYDKDKVIINIYPNKNSKKIAI